MSAITEEIQKLQSRILELETQKKKLIQQDERYQKTSLEHNFNVISEFNEVSITKKNEFNAAMLRRYPDFDPDNLDKARKYGHQTGEYIYCDKKFTANMESIYNILQILDKRLNKIEEYIGPNIKKE